MAIGPLMFICDILIRKTHLGRKIKIYFIFLQIITKTKFSKINWKRDLPSYYLPFLLNLTTLSKVGITDFLIYRNTALFHNKLVLYKGANKGTGKDCSKSMPGT